VIAFWKAKTSIHKPSKSHKKTSPHHIVMSPWKFCPHFLWPLSFSHFLNHNFHIEIPNWVSDRFSKSKNQDEQPLKISLPKSSCTICYGSLKIQLSQTNKEEEKEEPLLHPPPHPPYHPPYHPPKQANFSL